MREFPSWSPKRRPPEPLHLFSCQPKLLGSKRRRERGAGPGMRARSASRNTPYTRTAPQAFRNQLSSSWISEGAELTFLGGADLADIDFLIVGSFTPPSTGKKKSRGMHPPHRGTRACCWIRNSSISRFKAFKKRGDPGSRMRPRQNRPAGASPWREVPETLHFDPLRDAEMRSRDQRVHDRARSWPRAPVSAPTPLTRQRVRSPTSAPENCQGAISWTRRHAPRQRKKKPPAIIRARNVNPTSPGPWKSSADTFDPKAPDAARSVPGAALVPSPNLDGDAPAGAVGCSFFPLRRHRAGRLRRVP